MNRIFAFLVAAIMAGCTSTDQREADIGRLTDSYVESLAEKLERWSQASEADDHVLEGLLRRDLRREAGRMIDPLKIGLSSSDPEKRSVCAAALGFSEDVSSISLLTALLRDGEPEVRANAMLSLCLIGSVRTPLAPVLESTGDLSPEVRRHGLYLLGMLAAPENVNVILPALIAAMSDSDPEVRENASFALDRAQDPRAGRILADAGLSDSCARVRLNSAVALGRIKSAEFGTSLVRALKREMNKSVAREMRSALSKITGKDHGSEPEVFEKALNNP